MDKNLISCWWKTLLHLDADMLQSDGFPLAGMDACLEHYHLPLPAIPPVEHQKLSGRALPEPSFENLTLSILANLQQSLNQRGGQSTTHAWAEKLLRFCEIRLPSLKARARRKWGDGQTARLNFLQVATFLLDFARKTGDLRYLNVVFKLCDQKWIFNPRMIERDLKRGGGKTLAALFQMRILFLCDYALDMVRKVNS